MGRTVVCRPGKTRDRAESVGCKLHASFAVYIGGDTINLFFANCSIGKKK